MNQSQRFGIASLLLGGIAICLAFAANYATSVHGADDSVVLDWADRLGLIRSSKFAVPEMKADSVFLVTDRTAIGMLYACSIVLSVFSVILALFSEYKKEPTLYRSAGFVCGILALALVNLWAALIMLIFGVATFLYVKGS